MNDRSFNSLFLFFSQIRISEAYVHAQTADPGVIVVTACRTDPLQFRSNAKPWRDGEVVEGFNTLLMDEVEEMSARQGGPQNLVPLFAQFKRHRWLQVDGAALAVIFRPISVS